MSAHENDGTKLFSALQNCQTQVEISDVIGDLEGPYAFVFYQVRSYITSTVLKTNLEVSLLAQLQKAFLC